MTHRCLLASTTLVAVTALILTSCTTSNGPDPAALEASAAARVMTIPPTTPDKYKIMVDKNLIDKKGWQNPYLIIKTGGVALLDPDNHVEHLLTPQELTQALGNLPASAWPYGRVVAITESAVRVQGDDVLIRKNRALVNGTLDNLHVLIHYIPPA